ncbi:MAG: response regulator transcription factor [Acidobacteriia bacterium]|nr:response regulator transcription factor [Terriglobia bacterium]
MPLKIRSVLDSNVATYSNETQPAKYRGEINAQICVGAGFEELGRSLLDDLPHWTSQPLEFHNDDYEIALVPRNRSSRTGPTLQSSTTMDRVLLLSLTWQELLDRVRGQLGHSRKVEQGTIARFGDVRVNFLTMEVSRSEEPVALTAQEFKLLRFLTQTPERVFSRGELLNEVWGYNNYPSTRTVDNHVCTLRQKLEAIPAQPIHFLTVHGVGYKFVP